MQRAMFFARPTKSTTSGVMGDQPDVVTALRFGISISGTVGWEPKADPKIIEKIDEFARW
jgi:hypothetical protein